MRRLVLVIALVMLLVILAISSASAVPDSDTSPTYSDTSNSEIAANRTEAGNSSASTAIGITMTRPVDGSLGI